MLSRFVFFVVIHFPYRYVTVECKAVYIFNRQSFQRLEKKKKWLCKRVLMKTLVCAFLYAYVCFVSGGVSAVASVPL